MSRLSLFLHRMLPTALALGTAWAARGQIGHEYGAAWAAAIGILTIITLSGRQDWVVRIPVIVTLGCIAWGAGGMISYGKVVGYGHAPDYLNTSYGLMMLVVIGALYGFMGGGITGLALESTPAKKIDWAVLLTQMVAGGFLFWGFFIYQLEWLMTPPRSELWAGCLGASIALGWYLYRNGHAHALRTASFSALGSGFGFAFGNFLQRMGQASGIQFNWWNVMEYSIGFFGGLGMAYGIFANNNWPVTIKPNKISNTISWIFLVVLLPAINFIEAANTKGMRKVGEGLHVSDPAAFAFNWQAIIGGLFLLFMIVLTVFYRKPPGKKIIAGITLTYLAWYIVFSNFISAVWLTPKFVSQHLYWINWIILFLFLYKRQKNLATNAIESSPAYLPLFLKCCCAALLLILLISYIAVTTTTGRPDAQLRF